MATSNPGKFAYVILHRPKKTSFAEFNKFKAILASVQNRTKHYIFFANKDFKITQNCTTINSNGRLQRDQWSSSQAATQVNILIKFKILQ